MEAWLKMNQELKSSNLHPIIQATIVAFTFAFLSYIVVTVTGRIIFNRIIDKADVPILTVAPIVGQKDDGTHKYAYFKHFADPLGLLDIDDDTLEDTLDDPSFNEQDE